MRQNKLNIIITLLFLLICPVIFGQNSNISDNFESVIITQNGKKIKQKNDTYIINREKFEIVFTFKEPISFLINGWITSESYDVFYNETDLDEIIGFYHTGMAEGLNNDSMKITLFQDGPNSWFYSDKINNRFDKNVISDQRIICTRTIENITILGDGTMAIEDTSFNELFLCILEYNYDNGTGRNELSRKRIKIVFN